MSKKKSAQQEKPFENSADIFSETLPPPAYVWEHEFDYCDKELQQLAVKDWRQIQAAELTGYYLLNLTYVDPLQPEVFRYLFPVCLAVWCESMIDGHHFEDFLYAVHRGNILDRMLTPKEKEGVLNVLCDGFLHRLEQERGFVYTGFQTPAYLWLYAFNELGATQPVIETIWQRWWTLDSPGKAVSAMMYASGLIYEEGENPIFRPWSKTHGGGGPYLAELNHHFDGNGWLPENLAFFKKTLTAERLLEDLERAAVVLQGQQEEAMANRLVADARQRHEIIAIQIDDLIENLASQY